MEQEYENSWVEAVINSKSINSTSIPVLHGYASPFELTDAVVNGSTPLIAFPKETLREWWDFGHAMNDRMDGFIRVSRTS